MYKKNWVGFSLIELLVVMVVVSMAIALIAPNLWGTLKKYEEKNAVEAFANALLKLRRGAYEKRKAVHLKKDEVAEFARGLNIEALSDPWVLVSSTDFYVMPTGVTNSAEYLFISPSQRKWSLIFHPFDTHYDLQNYP